MLSHRKVTMCSNDIMGNVVLDKKTQTLKMYDCLLFVPRTLVTCILF